MITITEYSGRAVGVFGLGKAGEATIASLLAGGAEVYAWDDKASGTRADAAHLVPFAQWPWERLQALVLSPGVPLTHPEPHAVVKQARAHNCPIVGDVELLCRAQPKARFVGITGTNGKSTTTTLIGHILKTAGIKTEIGGNLGTAALALAPLGEEGVYVIETSSYQLDLLHSARFNVALLLNITPDHLDRHGDMQGYINAKMHIFERQNKDDVAVIAADDDYTKEMVPGRKYPMLGTQKLVSVSSQRRLKAGVSVEAGKLYDGEKLVGDISGVAALTGRHNWQNAAAAYAVCRAIGIAPDVIYAAMKTFGGLRHRLQLVAEIDGVRFINDSKATNADATQNALAPYENIYWILGGKAKAGGIDTLGQFFPKIAHAFLIGEASDDFAKVLEGRVAFTRSETLDVAVAQAAHMAFADKKKDAVVLLSPACASFDQFTSFEHRGDAFCSLVEALKGKVRHAV